jgi:hypothetical protein
VIWILFIVGVVIFHIMEKQTALEKMEGKLEGEAIPLEPAEGGAPAETPLPPESSEFVQAPPIMEEDVPID